MERMGNGGLDWDLDADSWRAVRSSGGCGGNLLLATHLQARCPAKVPIVRCSRDPCFSVYRHLGLHMWPPNTSQTGTCYRRHGPLWQAVERLPFFFVLAGPRDCEYRNEMPSKLKVAPLPPSLIRRLSLRPVFNLHRQSPSQ